MSHARCTTTGKLRYRREASANRVLGTIWSHAKPGRRLETRAYRCEHCNGWHLTSKPNREGAAP